MPVDALLHQLPGDVSPGRVPGDDIGDEANPAAGTKHPQPRVGIDAEEPQLREDVRGLLDPGLEMNQRLPQQPFLAFPDVRGKVHLGHDLVPLGAARWRHMLDRNTGGMLVARVGGNAKGGKKGAL